MATAIGIIGLAIAAGSAAYSGVSSADAADKAEKQVKKQEMSARKLQTDFENTQMNLEKSNAGKDAKARQAKIAAGATGRGDTILTGPTGNVGEVPNARKTLLGL